MKGRSSIRNKVIIIIATFTVACAWFLLEVPRIWPSFFVIISSDLQFFISSIDFYVPGHSVFNVTQIPLNRRFANWSSSISYNITSKSSCSCPGNPGTVRLEISSMFGTLSDVGRPVVTFLWPAQNCTRWRRRRKRLKQRKKSCKQPWR